MEIAVTVCEPLVVIAPKGRLDNFGSKDFQSQVDATLSDDLTCGIFDLRDVDYLSSAGLRVFVSSFREFARRGGVLAIANLHPYCREVMDIAGLAGQLPVFDSTEQAVEHCRQVVRERRSVEHWGELETVDLGCGSATVIPGSDDPGTILVLGHIDDVLYARVTPAHLHSKRFSETEYSIGLGGLGDRVDDYLGILGEMITIGGTMVWLPTDGHDTPDFLIPRTDRGNVTLRTAYDASIAGRFNETLVFESRDAGGTPIDALYRGLFRAAKARRRDFRGVLGLAMRAQMGAVFGSGVTRSPVADAAPPNGRMIIDRDNINDWFEFDTRPRHQCVTGLLCGVGVDLTGDLSAYDRDYLGAIFYMHPANTASKTEMVHNHGVFFTEQPMPERPVNLEREIRAVVERGDFIDMRHLLDATTITRACIGISYIQDFRRDAGEAT